ncbi:MAG: 50S ribosomal protein L4 [Myxococcota bacterium]|nr:50S ribosomal protein L4 [Myxococcota bacterium]
MQIDIVNLNHEKTGTVDLPEDVFGTEVKTALLWEQVKAQRASKRRGTHDTKTRANVRGGGAKPFKQKGTGRARQGSTRAPNQVGGGVVFGPHPRDYSYRLPRSARRAALRSALSLRASENAIVVLDGAALEAPKTKTVAQFFGGLDSKSALIVDVENQNLALSTRNLEKAKFLEVDGLNVYDILKHEKLVVTKASLESIVARAKKAGKTVTEAVAAE